MIILSLTFPDELAELEKLTKIPNQALVRHWLDELAGNYNEARAKFFEPACCMTTWIKQCDLIINALRDQIPTAAEYWKDKRLTVVPYVESMEEMEKHNQQLRADNRIHLPWLSTVPNEPIEEFLRSDADAIGFAVPEGLARNALVRQIGAVKLEVSLAIVEGPAGVDWDEWWAQVGQRQSDKADAQYRKLLHLLGCTDILSAYHNRERQEEQRA
jgi:hypothetical protein